MTSQYWEHRDDDTAVCNPERKLRNTWQDATSFSAAHEDGKTPIAPQSFDVR